MKTNISIEMSDAQRRMAAIKLDHPGLLTRKQLTHYVNGAVGRLLDEPRPERNPVSPNLPALHAVMAMPATASIRAEAASHAYCKANGYRHDGPERQDYLRGWAALGQ